MAGQSPPSESAMKDRIITHMNNDHIDSVQRYVEHYSHVSRFTSRTARLTDITNAHMTITAGGKQYQVAFDPPMKSLMEARPRVVQMDADCIEGLGRSPFTIKEFPLPPIWSIGFVGVTIGSFFLLTSDRYVQPGSPFHDYYLRFVPYMTEIFQKYRVFFASCVIGAHAIEAYIISNKMEKHSVPVLSTAWLGWVASGFLLGFPTFKSLNDVVEKQRIAKEKAKH